MTEREEKMPEWKKRVPYEESEAAYQERQGGRKEERKGERREERKEEKGPVEKVVEEVKKILP